MPPFFVADKAGTPVKFKIAGSTPNEAEWARINSHLGLEPEPPKEEELSAFGSGLYGMTGAVKTGVGTGIAAFGAPETGQEWIDSGTKDVEDAKRRFTPSAPAFEDIKGVGDFGNFVYENTLSSIPYMAPMIAGGIAGAPGGPIGMGAGALAGGTLMYQGINTRRKAEESGLQPQDVSFIEALPYSIVEAAADEVLPYTLKIMGTVGKTAVKAGLNPVVRQTAQRTWAGFVKNVSLKTMEAAMIESGTETFQQAVEILHANPDKLWNLSPETRSELVNAAAAGFFVGGLIGGANVSFVGAHDQEDPFKALKTQVDTDADTKVNEQIRALAENRAADTANQTPYQDAVEGARLADENYRAAEAARSSSIEAATKAGLEEQAQRPVAKQFAQPGVNIVPLVGKDGTFAYEVRSPSGEFLGTAPDAQMAQSLAAQYRKGLTGPKDEILEATLARLPLKELPADTRKAIQLSRYNADANADVDAPVGWEEAENVAGMGDFVRKKLGIPDDVANLQQTQNLNKPDIQVTGDASPSIKGMTDKAAPPKVDAKFPDLEKEVQADDVTGLTYDIREEASGVVNPDGKGKNVPHQVVQGTKKFFFPTEKAARDRAQKLFEADPTKPVEVRPSRKAYSVYEVGETADGRKVQRFLGAAPNRQGAEAIQREGQALRSDPAKWKAAFEAAQAKHQAEADAARIKRDAAEEKAGAIWQQQQADLQKNQARNQAAATALGAAMEKMGIKNATVRLQKVITDPKDPQAVIEGSHFDKVITLATDVWSPGMSEADFIKALSGVMNHELIHHLYRIPGLISETERKALNKYVAKVKARVNGKEVGYTWLERASVQYESTEKNPVSNETIVEEAVAEAFRSWVENRNNVVVPQPKSLFQRFLNFFKELFKHKNATAEKVFTDIAEGRRSDEGAVDDGQTRYSKLPKADSYGGILVNAEGKVLLREPTNHYGGYVWTFAKGRPDFDGEDATDVAHREVEQETGYKAKVVGTLDQSFEGTTGTTAFHIMEPVGEQGQTDAETASTRWVTFEEAAKLIGETTAPAGRERDLKVLKAAQEHLDKQKTRFSKSGTPTAITDEMVEREVNREIKEAEAVAAAKVVPHTLWMRDGVWTIVDEHDIVVHEIPYKPGKYKDKQDWERNARRVLEDINKDRIVDAKTDAYNDYMRDYEFNKAQIRKKLAEKFGLPPDIDSFDYSSVQLDSHVSGLHRSIPGKKKAGAFSGSGATYPSVVAEMKLSELTRVGDKPGGSNPGGVYRDKAGNKWMVKGSLLAGQHKNARAVNEALAADLFNVAVAPHLRTPAVKLIDLGDKYGGGLGVAVEWRDGLVEFDLDSSVHLRNARDAFVAHAWLMNYDALGMGYDNVMYDPGTRSAVTVDMGGALMFRAQGLPKAEPFHTIPKEPTELASMRQRTVEQKKVYGQIESGNLARGASKLNLVPEAAIHKAVTEHFHGRIPPENVTDIARTLVERRNEIVRLVDMELKERGRREQRLMGPGAITRIGAALPVELNDTVYGEQAAVMNRLLNDERFREYYRDSVIFDPDGRPIIWFHATRGHENITYFHSHIERSGKYSLRSKQGKAGRGIVSLSSDAGFHKDWVSGEGVNVYPLLVAAKRVGDFRKKEDIIKALEYKRDAAFKRRDNSFNGKYEFDRLASGDWGPWEESPRMLDDLGWDAVYMLEHSNERSALNLAVRNTDLIKSVFNIGTWDTTRKHIRYSRSTSPSMNYARQIRPHPNAVAHVRGKWMYGAAADLIGAGLKKVAPASWADKIQNTVDEKYRILADKMLPVGRLVDAIVKAGGNIEDAFEPYLQGELLAGRTGDMLRVAKETYYDPAVRAVANLTYGQQDLDGLRQVAPNFAKMADDRADSLQMGMANAYLAAKHAAERNALIQARTPQMVNAAGKVLIDTNVKGSGFDTAEANAAVAWFERGREAARLRDIKAKVEALIVHTNKVRRDFDLIPDFARLGEADDWHRAAELPGFAYMGTEGFKHYVPLRGLIEEDPLYDPESAKDRQESETVIAGHAKKIKGKEDQNTLGRNERPPPLLFEHMIAQNMSAIIRGQTNAQLNSFVTMLEQNNGADVQYHGKSQSLESLAKIVDQIPITRTLANGIVKLVPDSRYKNNPNVLVAKRRVKDDAGHDTGQIEEVVVEINNEPLRAALIGNNGTGPKNAEKMIYTIGKVTRFMAKMATQWNPVFLLTNFPRDLGAAMINLQQYEMEGLSRDVFANVMPAMRSIWNSSPHRNLTYAVTGKDQATRNVTVNGVDWTALNQEFMASGGDLSFWGLKDLDDIRQDINAEIFKETPHGVAGVGKEAFKRIVNLIEANNKAVESAVRLATYKALKDKGLSKEQAAQGAKNVTVNFDKGGEAKGLVNSLYMFYNASLQGSLVIASALARSKKVRRMVGGIAAYGLLQDMLMSSIMGDDDKTGMSKYDQIPEHVLRNRLIIPDPTGHGYLAIPMPYGYNAFHNFGRSLGKAARGKYDTGEFIASSLGAFVDAFNPIGGTSSLLGFAAPTILDPLVELAENKDFAGRSIYPNDNPFGLNEPGSQKHFANTNPVFVKLADLMSKLTGGEDWFPGLVEIHPDTMEYLFEYYLSGVGAFVNQMGNFATTSVPDLLAGEEVSFRDIPVVSKFAGNFTDQVATEQYYHVIDQVGRTKKTVDAAIKSGDPESIKLALTRDKSITAISGQVQALDSARKTLSATIKKIDGNPRIPDDRKRELVKPLKERKTALEQKIVKVYNTRE